MGNVLLVHNYSLGHKVTCRKSHNETTIGATTNKCKKKSAEVNIMFDPVERIIKVKSTL